MPVFSYLAYPSEGGKNALLKDLKSLEHCEVIGADNRDVLILITDTPDETKERALQEKLNALKSLQSLSMTFGHSDVGTAGIEEE